jgi:hypothetical protein
VGFFRGYVSGIKRRLPQSGENSLKAVLKETFTWQLAAKAEVSGLRNAGRFPVRSPFLIYRGRKFRSLRSFCFVAYDLWLTTSVPKFDPPRVASYNLSPTLEPTPYLEKIMREALADYKAGKNITRTTTKAELENYLDKL